ncbi:biopolymer transporter ExbD [Thalassoglobus sp. JC818]|uniref:ExbD/TolR family protein n=1 Tax=Thalassoglobus sp. JC818 TaxID=3232136 RepID=UPI0034598B70
MPANFSKSKRVDSDDDDLDITPMIDVTFLLLIFFMVTSNMKKAATVHIPPARHGQGIALSKSTVLTIFNTDGEPEIYLSDGTKENGPVTPEEVTAYVNAGIPEGKLNVIIKADSELPSGYVEEVARAANNTENEAELKFYVGVMDKDN